MKKVQKLAGSKDVTLTTIMKWYADAKGIRERIEAVEIMEERIKIAQAKAFEEGYKAGYNDVETI